MQSSIATTRVSISNADETEGRQGTYRNHSRRSETGSNSPVGRHKPVTLSMQA